MTERPILLLANFRTGSSDYSYKLAIDNNLEWLPEPHLFPGKMELLSKLITENKPFVLKIMPEHIGLHQQYETVLNGNCYKIKLTRKSKIDQIVSFYISSMTQVWNSSNKFARGETYAVNIDQGAIRQSIEIILNNDSMLDNSTILFNEELTYEDLVENKVLGTKHSKIIPPRNFNLIKKAVEREYAKYR